MVDKVYINGEEINPVDELLLKPTFSIGGRTFEIPKIEIKDKETGKIRELTEDEAFSFLFDLADQGVNIFRFVKEV